MEVSTRDWALALSMIERLQQTCKAFEEMFGKLCPYLSQAGLSTEQIQALNDDWDRSMTNHIDDVTAKEEDFHLLTETGVVKGTKTRTLEDAFEQMQSEALDRFRSEMGGPEDVNPQ